MSSIEYIRNYPYKVSSYHFMCSPSRSSYLNFGIAFCHACRLDSALLDILKKDTEGRLGRWREQSIALGLLVSEATRKVEQDVDETDYGDIQASAVQLKVRWNGLGCEMLGFGIVIQLFTLWQVQANHYLKPIKLTRNFNMNVPVAIKFATLAYHRCMKYAELNVFP